MEGFFFLKGGGGYGLLFTYRGAVVPSLAFMDLPFCVLLSFFRNVLIGLYLFPYFLYFRWLLLFSYYLIHFVHQKFTHLFLLFHLP